MLFSSSLNFEVNIWLPILSNNSSIPKDVHADVNLKKAPIFVAKFLASSSPTSSLSNRSLLFPANPMTKRKK